VQPLMASAPSKTLTHPSTDRAKRDAAHAPIAPSRIRDAAATTQYSSLCGALMATASGNQSPYGWRQVLRKAPVCLA